MSEIIIFDTSVLVDDLRTGCYHSRFQCITGLVRNSSVVLSELWRGATRAAEREFVRILGNNHPTYTPTENMWLDSGRMLATIRAEKGFSAEKLRDLHLDVLIALTARAHGALLITSNRSDFELIRRKRSFKLEVWFA